MSLSSVRSETALRSRLFSSSRSFRRFTCSVFSPPNSWRHREYVTSLTPIWRIASTMFWPCETKTSTCRNFATISSGLYRFLAITVLLDVKDIPQVGLLQRGGSVALFILPWPEGASAVALACMKATAALVEWSIGLVRTAALSFLLLAAQQQPNCQ